MLSMFPAFSTDILALSSVTNQLMYASSRCCDPAYNQMHENAQGLRTLNLFQGHKNNEPWYLLRHQVTQFTSHRVKSRTNNFSNPKVSINGSE